MSEVFRLLFIGREWSTDSGILGAALLGEEGKKKKKNNKNFVIFV